MPEGGTYLTTWERVKDGFRLWLDQDESVEVVSSDFDEAVDELASRVLELTGDGEAVLEFLTPRPPAGSKAVVERLRFLGYNESVAASSRLPEHYTGGLCPHCEFGVGQRTEVPLEVDRLPSADIAGVDRTLPPALIVSNRLLELLTTDSSAGIATQPIGSPTLLAGYRELIGVPIASAVGISGAAYPEAFHQSWSCSYCGRRVLTVDHPDFPVSSSFIAEDSLPDQIPEVFVFDEGSRLLIALSEDRWRSVAAAGLKGVTTGPLFVIPDTAAELEPDLPTPEEFDWVL